MCFWLLCSFAPAPGNTSWLHTSPRRGAPGTWGCRSSRPQVRGGRSDARSLVSGWRLAVGEESVSHNLARLSTRRVVVGPEVWSVLRSDAWLTWYAPAQVPSHYSSRYKTLYVVVEG